MLSVDVIRCQLDISTSSSLHTKTNDLTTASRRILYALYYTGGGTQRAEPADKQQQQIIF